MRIMKSDERALKDEKVRRTARICFRSIDNAISILV